MDKSGNLESLRLDIERCVRCPLHRTRRNAVPGEGPSNARLVFVGEAPGAMEDESGRPFVGRSGELLTRLLEEIGLSRQEVFITSVLKSRPPNNRVPRPEEVEACRPYLERQIELIEPQIVVLLGTTAVSTVIGPWKMSEAHGRFYDSGSHLFFITYHPAAALRFPRMYESMREDMKILRRELK